MNTLYYLSIFFYCCRLGLLEGDVLFLNKATTTLTPRDIGAVIGNPLSTGTHTYEQPLLFIQLSFFQSLRASTLHVSNVAGAHSFLCSSLLPFSFSQPPLLQTVIRLTYAKTRFYGCPTINSSSTSPPSQHPTINSSSS